MACPNAVPTVEENACAGAGSEGWRIRNPDPRIAGFATTTSVAAGEDVVLKIGRAGETPGTTTADVRVYRIGYYGGAGGFYIPAASQEAVTVNNDQQCEPRDETTGLLSCANWEPTYTIEGEDLRASGIYVAHIEATDTGWDNQIIFVVRDDERSPQSEILLQVPLTTYEAYNNWGGKSLYDFNSSNEVTISGGPRAAKVSFDRPFANPMGILNDWFMKSDFALAYWLERQGYDVSYTDDQHTSFDPEGLLDHQAFLLGGHDEYWTGEEFGAVKAAREAGVNIASFGADAAYWKVRYEDGGRTLVCYKTVQGSTEDGSAGANDWGPDGIEGTEDDALGLDGEAGTEDDKPENSTTTFRDDGASPEDPNAPPGGRVGPGTPENSLFGAMYVGDRGDGTYFPLEVPEAEGGEFAGDRIWRHTAVSGKGATLGSKIGGWEWDAIPTQAQYLSHQPAGVKVLAESHPSSTNWLQDEGRVYGSTPPPGQPPTAMAVKYTAKSGALVFSAGTTQWTWGLGPHWVDLPSGPTASYGAEPVDSSEAPIEQATANILADMDVAPNTPDGITLDGGNEPPNASFAMTPSPAASGETVSFDASASADPDGEIVDYAWDLDGNGSFETNTGKTPTVTHEYSSPGSFEVKLRTTDNGASTDTASRSLTVFEPVSGPYPEAVLDTEGLAHYWRLGESTGSSLADIAGGANATSSGATLGV
ncbi:MAG TPA: PKD domain-containing protein, partial [Solirubrobacterales bacterium]|nr:PKD domain-containing protein [Solirubrobacterales bacterium]